MWVRIGDVTNVKGGKRVPKGYTLLDTPTSHIYIRVTNMKENTLIPDKLKYISNEIYEAIKNYIINKEDLYLTIAGTIGKAGEVPPVFDNMNLTENAVKLTNIQIDKSFLLKLLQSPCVQHQFHQKTNKVAQPKLAIERILSTYIPLPPLKEQQRIVTRLESLEPFIEDYDKANTELTKLNAIFPEQIKKSILQYAIQGKLVPQDPNDEPALALLETIKAEKQKLIKAGKIKKDKVESYIYKRDNRHYEKIDDKEVDITDEIPFEIPDNWAWTRLGHIGFSRIGLTYKPQDICEEGTPVLRSGNIQNGEIILNNMVHVNCEVSHNLLVKNGDILICVRNGSKSLVGKNAIINSINVGEKMSFGAFMAIFRSKLNEYIKIYLDSALFKTMLKSTKTETINQITQSNLNRALIPIPPYTEQKRIVEKIEQLFKTLS
ncbi:restriction endonuclease subunit S [Candidatus Proelusimicrobium volucris]|uniref:restriction endonuclease subunit S n=1 Tax=Candidatus Proelusimicrobium volucris TaxID=3416225 RepID=UPI003D0C9DC9